MQLFHDALHSCLPAPSKTACRTGLRAPLPAPGALQDPPSLKMTPKIIAKLIENETKSCVVVLVCLGVSLLVPHQSS